MKSIEIQSGLQRCAPAVQSRGSGTGREGTECRRKPPSPAAPRTHPRNHAIYPEPVQAENAPLECGRQRLQRHVCRQQRGCGEVLLRSVQNTTGRQPAPVENSHHFSFAANEEQNAVGEIVDETFEPEAMDSSAKEFCRLPSTITTPVSKPISARTAKPFRTTTAIWQNG